MPLSSGDKLGHHEVLSLLGQGGMGEVYRARDTKLDREVAIKVLPETVGQDPERLARFEREAKVLASLNHPNIAHIYGVEERALVMELVEGESPKGPLPFDEAWKIASQIAAGLECAHEKGIVHRDLKPANIKVTPDGIVKLLDFGLAKAFRAEAVASSDGDQSPTLTLGATQLGVILGTAAYMAPEQARGRNVDKRADIWSFGVVLFELLTGDRLFKGDDVSETLAHVLTKTPEIDKAPVQARRLLQRCLEKDPKNRLRDIAEARYFLEPASGGADRPAQAANLSHNRPWGWIATAGAAVVVAGALAAIHFRETLPQAQLMRFEISAPEKTSLNSQPVLSPDGRMLAFSATGSDGRTLVWVRDVDTLAARALPGTEGAQSPVFWSPDSRSLAYSGESIHKLMRIDVAGGPPQTLCSDVSSGAPFGAWSREGVIVYKAGNSLNRVSAAGGMCSPVTALDTKRNDTRHTVPAFLPDGKHFLYVRLTSRVEQTGIYIGSLDATPEKQDTTRLLAADSGAVYAPSARDPKMGYLLFRRENALLAQPFDPRRRALAGDAVPIAGQVGVNNELGLFSVSSTGLLAYRAGVSEGNTQIAWYDRAGKVLGPVTELGGYSSFSISPDGTRVALQRLTAGSTDIWLHEFARGTTGRLTFDPAQDRVPVWSPTGDRVVWSSRRDGPDNLYQKVSNSAGDEQALLKSAFPKIPTDWSRDGRFLLYQVNDPKTGFDLWILPMGGREAAPSQPKEGRPVLATPARETNGQFSPDGKFIAYTSDATGQNQIYVRPFSTDGTATGQWMVSVDGGVQPRWSRDGKELFFLSPDSKLMSAPVNMTGGTFRPLTAQPLFPVPISGGGGVNFEHRWDVAPDGKKFLFTVVAATSSAPITVVVNWQELLKK